MCVAPRRYLVNFLFSPRLPPPPLLLLPPDRALHLFYLWAFRDSLVGLTPSIGERELRQFVVKVTGQFTNYRSVNSRANEDYRRSARRRDAEGCQGRAPRMTTTTIVTTITATTVTATATVTVTTTTTCCAVLLVNTGEPECRDCRRFHWKIVLSLLSHPRTVLHCATRAARNGRPV